MIRIGIVDDELRSRDLVLEYLHRYETEHNVTFSVRTFADGSELADGYRPEFDIIFLDVQMTHMDGLETAHQIRLLDANVVLVFITNMAQYAIRGYEVDALSYLVKPVPYFAFSQELRRSIARVTKAGNESIMVPTPGGLARVDLMDIVYIESVKHRIILHAIDRTYSFTGTLKALDIELTGKEFFRSNNCYLVNLRYVTSVSNNSCTMLGGDELLVSRPRKRGFLDALADHVGGKLP